MFRKKLSSWIYLQAPDEEIVSISNRAVLYNQEGEKVKAYKILKPNLIVVPRFLLSDEELSKYKTIGDIQTIGEKISIKMNRNYIYRNQLQKEAVDILTKSNSGIIAARVGFGKTFIAIKYITKLKRKALILVHKAPLMEQWKERLLEYTNIKEDEIGIIRGNDFQLEGKKVVIAMVQTLLSKLKRDEDVFNKMREANFGVTFFDECHITIGPGAFLQVSKLVYSKKVFGLSATPYRSDGLSKIIYWTIGKILWRYRGIDVKVNVFKMNVPIDISSKTSRYLTYGGMFNKQRYVKYILKNANYFEWLKEILNYFIENDQYHVLFLADRRDILNQLKELHMDNDEIGLYYSGSSEKEKSKRIVLSTYQMFKEGLDVPRLNTLVFSTPMGSKVSVEQALGRIIRDFKGKTDVYIIDIVNSRFFITNKLEKKRNSVYADFNASFFKATVDDSKLVKTALEKFFSYQEERQIIDTG